jgi:putative membrane protein
MTAKTKYILKMVLVMLLIIAAPAIFFGSIGDNPLLVRENATRTIAVVNEDTGADKEDKSLDFGKEITSILSDGSQYEWTVIGRSAAENGLRNTKYDAVVYIPSNFSRNIMSYESKQPEKANFEYTVQNQLNSLNREKVLREIQTATNRVNGKISTLYWTYVSQDLENVKSQFDTILQKEIDFQNAMLAFYKPSSKNLAAEIEQQRNMLESIQSTVKTAAESTSEGENNLTQFEESLAGFVQYVEQYQEYQDAQQETLQKMQDESVLNIQSLTGKQDPMYSESLTALNEGGEQLSSTLDSVESQLKENSETFTSLTEIRTEQVDRQREELINYLMEQERINLSQVQGDIASLKQELSKGTSAGNPGTGSAASNKSYAEKQTAANTNPNTAIPSVPGLENERAELQAIANEINAIKSSLETIEGTPEQAAAAIANLPKLSQRLLNVEQNISENEPGENPLQAIVDELQAKNSELLAQNEKLVEDYNKLVEENKNLIEQLNNSGDFSSLIQLIDQKENEILELDLESERKTELTKIFNQPIIYAVPAKMMEYYSALGRFEGNVESSINYNPENLKSFIEKLNPIVKVNEDEQKVWDELNTSIPYSEEQLTGLDKQVAAFFNDYKQKIEEQQAAMQSDLSALQESAVAVMDNIQLLSSNTTMPVDAVDGTSVMAKQEGISQRMLMINDLIGSIGENQSNIVSYTSELEQKVESVQQDADTLNSKWGSNVETTQMFRDDIYNLLGNTYVNGQKNGPVYEQLSSPLQISGETAAKKEESKLPPVVILAIVLLSSLMIGYFSHYFKNAPMLVHASMFVLLNLIVGLIISIFGLNIYSMEQDRAIEWTIFTILLLTAASAIVLAGFKIGNLAGWILSVGLIAFFISPFLALTAPNINYEDPMSKVYMSIQYDSQTLFIPAILILLGIIALLAIIPFAVRSIKDLRTKRDEDQAYEA